MDFFISGESRNDSFPLSSIVSDELNLIQKLEDDKLDLGKYDYDFNYLSCFKKWLSESDTGLIDKYFEIVSRDRLCPAALEKYELPFIDFFRNIFLNGEICIIFSKNENSSFFKPKSEKEFLTYIVMGLREIQLYSFYDLKNKVFFIPLRDLTLLVATPKNSSLDLKGIKLHVLD